MKVDINSFFLGNPSAESFVFFFFTSIYMGKTFAFGIILCERSERKSIKIKIIFSGEGDVSERFYGAHMKRYENESFESHL